MIRKLLKYMKQYRKAAILTPVFAALEVVMEVLIPYATAAMIDRGISAGSMPDIVRYGLIMIALAMVSLLFGVLAARFSANATTGFAANLRQAMYEKLQSFSFANIDKFSTAGLITRMTTDVNNVQNALGMLLRIAVRAPLTLFFSMMMCFIINPRLSLIFLGATLLLGCLLFLIIRKVSELFRIGFRKYDELNASVQENISGIRVVKAFVRGDFETEKFSKAAGSIYSLFVRAEKIIVLNNPVMMLTAYGCMLAVGWLGAQFVVSSVMTTGELTSLFTYVSNILSSLMMLSMIFVMLTMSLAGARRICEVLDEEPDLTNPEHPVTEITSGDIDFDHVSFAYHKEGSGEDTLHDIDLHIRSGETIGLIGGTGCGKSTLVSLISRLYDATGGSVKVGGRDVREYDTEALRNAVSVVLQKNVLFAGTVYENLRWGNENATEEECREACRQACADEFLEKLPEGYESRVEQGGSNFSGGQKQRLCIARALLKSPKVLILDDSTSAVDTGTDAKIRKAFNAKIPGTTKIIIAQRVSSVEQADRIIVMDNGRIAAFGTHAELLEMCSIYREINDTQKGSGDFDIAAPAAEGGEQA